MIRKKVARITRTRINKKRKCSNSKTEGNRRSNKPKREVTLYLIIVHVLENSGILDAYEYFLRAICKNGLP